LVASYVEVGSASDFVCSYAFAGFDIAKNSNFCHRSLLVRCGWERRDSKRIRGLGLSKGAEGARRFPIPVFTSSVPTLVPSSSKKKTISTRNVWLFLPWPTVRYEPFGIVGEAGICHFTFHFNQGNALSPFKHLFRAKNTLDSICSFLPRYARLSPHSHLYLRVVRLSNSSDTPDASGTSTQFPIVQQMTVARLIHWSTPKRRKAVSYLFALTFFASVVTVSTSNGLPCPARRDRRAYLDSEDDGTGGKNATVHVVEKKQRRWIQETRPTPTGHWPT
jgi:cytochrome c oxidase assembly factor 2